MALIRDYHLRFQDEQKLGDLAKKDPHLVLPEKRPQFTPEFFKLIGINYEPKVLGKGYIRLFWQDFIVEEIASDGRIISIEPVEEKHPEDFNLEKPKTEADLVKQGMPTIETIERLGEALKIPENAINYAGMKDSGAVTSQEISINGLKPEALQNLKIPNLFLKNIHQRKGVVEVGNLYGNRFTILVRSPQIDNQALKARVDQFNQEGFFNFYSLQRFGPRLLSHKIGAMILKSKYQEAIKLMLIGDSPHELGIFRNLRREAANSWGNWEKIAQIYSQFPYFLYYELRVMESLKETRIGFIKALQAIQEQTKLYVYAYFSLLFNQLLSRKITAPNFPEELLLLRDRPDIKNEYQIILSQDEMRSLSFLHRGLEFLNLGKLQSIKTKIIPQIWHVYQTPVGYIFHFDLGKGAYATTMLSEFFELFQGRPVPDWVNQQEFDTREPLGYQPIVQTIERFPKAKEKRDIDIIE